MESRPRIPWLYLILAYAFAWLLWIPLALTGQDYQSSPLLLTVMLIGVFGPGLAGIMLTYREGDPEQRRDYWRRMFDLRRIHPVWIGLILLIWPAMHVLALVFTRLMGGAAPGYQFVRELAAQPLGIPVVVVLYFLQAGLEELGWRGYMLERLLPGWGALKGSLIVGLFHAPWHLPLFWVVGTNQMKIGLGIGFALFVAQAVAFSIYATWCYVGNDHSTLAVTLFHTTGNLCLDIFAVEPGSMRNSIYTLIAVLGAVIVSAVWLAGAPERKKTAA